MLQHLTVRPRWHWLFLAGMACAGPVATAGQLHAIEVVAEADRYFLHADSWIGVPVEKVNAMFADFVHLPRLNGSLKRVRILERLSNGATRMEARSEFCLLAVCQAFVWVQDVSTARPGEMAMTIVPNRGDFKAGQGRWQMRPERNGTRLIFDVELAPNFWLPPVFGSWLMKRQLVADTLETLRALETLADSGGARGHDSP